MYKVQPLRSRLGRGKGDTGNAGTHADSGSGGYRRAGGGEGRRRRNAREGTLTGVAAGAQTERPEAASPQGCRGAGAVSGGHWPTESEGQGKQTIHYARREG
jgi:hypothetical protein